MNENDMPTITLSEGFEWIKVGEKKGWPYWEVTESGTTYGAEAYSHEIVKSVRRFIRRKPTPKPFNFETVKVLQCKVRIKYNKEITMLEFRPCGVYVYREYGTINYTDAAEQYELLDGRPLTALVD